MGSSLYTSDNSDPILCTFLINSSVLTISTSSSSSVSTYSESVSVYSDSSVFMVNVMFTLTSESDSVS